MRDVFENRLFVGSQSDYEGGVGFGLDENGDTDKWAFVLAAKEPWHRRVIGYTGRACDKAHTEYLIAKRDNKIILNLVDAPKPEFFDKRIIDAALEFIHEHLSAGKNVLACCNQGESRSPSIALLYLIKHGIIKGETLEDCEAEFLKVYPEYNPGAGMRGFVLFYFSEYKNKPFKAYF